MNATITLERHDGGAFQVTAGSDGSDQRHLIFAVPATNDSVQVDWRPGVDFTSGRPVEVALRIGTMPALRPSIADEELTLTNPPGEPQFGPGADGILDPLRDAFARFLMANPQAIVALHPGTKLNPSTRGKIGKAIIGDDPGPLADTVSEYAAVGAALGAFLTGDPGGAVAGEAMGVIVGVLVTTAQ